MIHVSKIFPSTTVSLRCTSLVEFYTHILKTFLFYICCMSNFILDDRDSIPSKVYEGIFCFLFATATRLLLGPTQLPVQWVTGSLSPRIKIIADLPLVLSLRMRGARPLLPICLHGVDLAKHRTTLYFKTYYESIYM
jgi:hypothetical protein